MEYDLARDLTGSRWIGWRSGFLCGLSGVIAAQLSLRMVS